MNDELDSQMMIEDPVMTFEIINSQDVTPQDILRFAKSILSTFAMLSLFAGLAELYSPQNNIFSAMREILPPMATMVIGFYFGKSN